MRSIYCIFILVTIFSSEVHSQFVFSGKVVSREQAKPLQGVSLSVDNKVLAVTDANGLFEFSSSSEKCKVIFSHVGYESLTTVFTNGQNKVVELNATGDDLLAVTVRAFEKNAALKNLPVTVTVLGKADLERYSNASILPAINTVP